jgi:predicted Zn-dependent peptidase
MRALALMTLCLIACGAAPKPIIASQKPVASVVPSVAPSASASAAPIDPHFREHEPELGAPAPFAMPDVHETKLSNGLRVLVANTGGGMFAMRIVFQGVASFPTERSAVARLMVKSMFGGTPTEDAHALRRVFEKRFAGWSTDTDPDSVTIDLWLPADDMLPCIDTMADVVMHPSFDQLTLGFELLQLVEQGQTALESPETLASRAFYRSVYGDAHVYARPATVLEGKPTVEHAEVERFYEEIADPTTTTIVLTGAVDRVTLEHVEHAFAQWHAHAHAASTPVAPIAWKTGPRVVVVDRPGSVQSQITFGGLAPARSSHDWYAMQLVHEILGAHRSSRITRALVDRDASSVSGSTHLDPFRAEGTFYWSSSVPLDRTASVLQEIDKAFALLGQTAPSASELAEKKALYLRQVPLSMEKVRDAAELIGTTSAFALPANAFSGLATNIDAVTADDVKNIAHDRLAPDHTRAIVVGDWAKMKTSLKSLGWGPIEIRSATGKLLRTEK